MFPVSQVYILALTLTLASCQLFTFDNGNVGVNFAGFKASAGLGGLLSGDTSKGGLHAEAGTPFGQSARAGLGGSLSNGGARGGLYAGATAGSGVSAAAGLEGATSDGVSLGNAAAGASAGGVHTGVEKSSLGLGGGALHVEKQVHSLPVHKEVYPKKYVQGNIETRVSHGPTDGGLLSRLFAGLAPAPAVNGHATGEFHIGGPAKAVGGYSASTHISGGNAGGGLFNDIFNIPISTLHAVNRLVNGITGGVTVTKTAHTFK